MLNRTAGYLVAAVAVLLWAGCATSPDPQLKSRPIPTISSCCPVPEGALANEHTDADEECWVNADRERVRIERWTPRNGPALESAQGGTLEVGIRNNAWMNLDTGEFCAEKGGEVFIHPCGHQVGPRRGNFNHRDYCPRVGHINWPDWFLRAPRP